MADVASSTSTNAPSGAESQKAEEVNNTKGGNRGRGPRNGDGKGRPRTQQDNEKNTEKGEKGDKSEKGEKGEGFSRRPEFMTADEKKKQKEIDEEVAKIAKIKAEADKISEQIKIKTKANAESQLQKEMQNIRTQLTEVSKQVKSLIDKKIKNREKIQNADNTRKSQEDAIKSARSALKIPKVADTEDANLAIVEEKIKNLELKLQTTTQSLNEEKAKMSEISEWRAQKNAIKDYHKLLSSFRQATDTRALKEEMNEADKAITEAKNNEAFLVKKLKALKEQNERTNGDVNALFKKRTELYAEVDKCYAVVKEKRAALNASMKATFESKKAEREEREKEKQAEYEARQEERKKRDLEKKEAEAKKIPFEAEIALCDSLIQFLQRQVVAATTADSAPSVESKETPKPNYIASLDKGMTVLPPKGRGDVPEEFVKVDKRQPKPKNKKKPVVNLSYNIDVLSQFTKVGVSTASTVDAIPATIKALEDRKEHFKVQGEKQKADKLKSLEKAEQEAKVAAEKASEEAEVRA